jgi:polysaccharide export outer membrane protein
MDDKNPGSIFKDGGMDYMLISGGNMGGSGGGGMAGVTKGYLVDKEGFIDFPVAGKIQIGGLTIRQAKEVVGAKLKDYVKDPVVELRILNYKVIVLGEVGRVGPIIAANHKINIIEAIAAAGDIPITGRKDNILITRMNNGKREYARVNINSKDIFNSPYYYLKQNDIIYVEPNKVRRQDASNFFKVYLPTFGTLLSTALAIYGVTVIANNK